MEDDKINKGKTTFGKMEDIISSYEKKNLELEEREMEMKYRLQMLENSAPAVVMWNMWRMMMTVQGEGKEGLNREGELMVKLRALESKLFNETALLEESKKTEQELQGKIDQLEKLINSQAKSPSEVQILEKLNCLARERLYRDKWTKTLETEELRSSIDNWESTEREEIEERKKDGSVPERQLAVLEAEAKAIQLQLAKKSLQKQKLLQAEQDLSRQLQQCTIEIELMKTALKKPLPEVSFKKLNENITDKTLSDILIMPEEGFGNVIKDTNLEDLNGREDEYKPIWYYREPCILVENSNPVLQTKSAREIQAVIEGIETGDDTALTKLDLPYHLFEVVK